MDKLMNIVVKTVNHNARIVNDNFEVVLKRFKRNERSIKSLGNGLILAGLGLYFLQKQVINLNDRVKKLEKENSQKSHFFDENENVV